MNRARTNHRQQGKSDKAQAASRAVATLVTGGSGFVGRQVVKALLESGAQVRVLIRQARLADLQRRWPSSAVTPVVADLVDPTSLKNACDGCDTAVHLASSAHADNPDSAAAADLHQRVTVEGTRALLDDAIRAGVRRFIYVSSVKAMGEGGDEIQDESSATRPISTYGGAKRQAEELVLAAGREHGIRVCVLRLPLVYGRDNRGNLPRMIAAVARGYLPPLPAISNRRSMVHVDDVAQAVLLGIRKPEANGQIYVVTDEHVYSTSQIYDWICAALGKPKPHWAVPVSVWRTAGWIGDVLQRLIGRRLPLNSEVSEKLFGSACYSSAKIRRELGFRPTRSLKEALAEMVAEYRCNRPI